MRKIDKVFTGLKETQRGHKVWFRIDNQTFYLNEIKEGTKEQSLLTAKLFRVSLDIAFEKIGFPPVKNL